MANGIQCAERTVRGRRRRDGFRSAHGGAVRKMNLTCGVHMSAREEREGVTDGRRDSKKKVYYPEYAIGASGPSGQWAGKPGGSGRPSGQGRGEQAGWAVRDCRAARSAGPKIKKNEFPNKNWISEFSKALENCRRRFRRNFDMRIFPKSL